MQPHFLAVNLHRILLLSQFQQILFKVIQLLVLLVMSKVANWDAVGEHGAKRVGPVVDQQHICCLSVANATQILDVDAWVEFNTMFPT